MHILRNVLLAGLLLAVCSAAQQLKVRLDGDGLHVTAPTLRFITGKPLEQMRNGSAVVFDVQLIVADELRSIVRRSFERFVVSYDLWEEKYAVASVRSARSSASRLSSSAAEAWCIDHVAIFATGLPETKPLVFRLDVQAQGGRRSTADAEEEEGLPLSSLIDIFSRVTKQQDPQHWRLDSAPVKLADLRKLSGRNGH